jgi:hypothetical protein
MPDHLLRKEEKLIEFLFLEARETVFDVEFDSPQVALFHQLDNLENGSLNTDAAILIGMQIGDYGQRGFDQILKGSVLHPEVHRQPVSPVPIIALTAQRDLRWFR